MAIHFEPAITAKYRLVAPPPARRTIIIGYRNVASYDMLCEQLHYFFIVVVYDQNPEKVGKFIMVISVTMSTLKIYVFVVYSF